MGLEGLFPWQNNREALVYRLSGTGISLDDLEQSPTGLVSYTPKESPQSGWHTPNGRVQWPDQSVMGLPLKTDKDYPLYLSTGDRNGIYHHSQYRESEKHRKIMPLPFLEIHPDTALKQGISDGDAVTVFSPYGSLDTHARLNNDLRTDALRMAHGWQEANVNELTGDEHFDPVSGFPWFRAIPAGVRKAGGIRK